MQQLGKGQRRRGQKEATYCLTYCLLRVFQANYCSQGFQFQTQESKSTSALRNHLSAHFYPSPLFKSTPRTSLLLAWSQKLCTLLAPSHFFLLPLGPASSLAACFTHTCTSSKSTSVVEEPIDFPLCLGVSCLCHSADGGGPLMTHCCCKGNSQKTGPY